MTSVGFEPGSSRYNPKCFHLSCHRDFISNPLTYYFADFCHESSYATNANYNLVLTADTKSESDYSDQPNN